VVGVVGAFVVQWTPNAEAGFVEDVSVGAKQGAGSMERGVKKLHVDQ